MTTAARRIYNFPRIKTDDNRYRRSWVKLWIQPWFDSSLRSLCSNDERGIFQDLIALAGKSRYHGGVIAAGEENGKLVGYPLRVLSALSISWTPEQIEKAIEIHERAGRIKVERQTLPNTGEQGYLIRITGWEKYQSEYERLKQYRNPKNKKRKNR